MKKYAIIITRLSLFILMNISLIIALTADKGSVGDLLVFSIIPVAIYYVILVSVLITPLLILLFNMIFYYRIDFGVGDIKYYYSRVMKVMFGWFVGIED